jgi:hypothetical protein
MTLYLLKVNLQTFLSIPIIQKCQILSCDTLVADERYTPTCFEIYMLSSGSFTFVSYQVTQILKFETVKITFQY